MNPHLLYTQIYLLFQKLNYRSYKLSNLINNQEILKNSNHSNFFILKNFLFPTVVLHVSFKYTHF